MILMIKCRYIVMYVILLFELILGDLVLILWKNLKSLILNFEN